MRREGPLPPWRERAASLRFLPRLLSLVWQTSRPLSIALGVLRLVRSFIPVTALWVGKLIVDTVVESLSGAPDWDRLWTYVAIELGIVILGEVLARASQLVESLLGDLFSNRMSVRLMRHAATLDLAQFEDPEFYDHLERARRQTTARLGLLAQLFGMVQDFITLATLAGALVAFNPWLVLLLVFAIVPGFLGETHFAALGYSLLFRRTPERRQLDYLRYVGASDETAKEVQMFGLAGWLADRYDALADQFYRENRELAIKRALVGSVLALLGTLGYYGAYVLILLDTVSGAITVGSLTFLAASFARSRDLVQRIFSSATDTLEQALYLRDLFAFFEMKPGIASPENPRPVPRPIRQGFVFENVGFRYPGSERWAVRNLNFEIGPGERLALVGENGAGKTTITKLLARLYDPSEGRVLLDGVDLREYDLQELRASIGVIFQDFVRFDMRFDENVGVGRITEAREHLDSVSLPVADNGDAAIPDRMRSSVEDSLAGSLLPRLPRGWYQMLGRRFEGGVDLSGGEWQKIALARAYMRDAQLLILDEPTAALDARAEYEVFQRFSELMRGRMAVLISHRFSTVRMADRIIVLQGGRITESGTHDELVQANGLYAELFFMQAAGYA
jgi:ATP-binding cassette subfamily B protein